VSRHILDRRCFMLTTICATGLAMASLAHADGEEPMLTITGELSYFQRIALPSQAIAFVRTTPAGATDETPATAETLIVLGGRQVSLALSHELPRPYLDAGTSYRLCGGVLVVGQVRWRTEPVPNDVCRPRFVAGMLLMLQQQAEE